MPRREAEEAGAEQAERRPGCALQRPEEGKGAGGTRGAQAGHGEMFLHHQGGQAPGQASGRARVPKGHRTVPSVIRFNFGLALQRSGRGLNDLCKVLPTELLNSIIKSTN